MAMRRLCLCLILVPLFANGREAPAPESVIQRPRDTRVTIELDLSLTKPTAPLLWGIFFEEINHIGVGGIYAEMVNDRSLEGMAHASGFRNDSTGESITSELEYTVPADAWEKFATQTYFGAEAGQVYIQPPSWKADNGTDLVLTKLSPLAPKNPINLKLSGVNGPATVANYGYWGFNLQEGYGYALSVYLNALTTDPTEVVVALQSSDGTQTYGSLIITDVTKGWAQYTGVLTSNATTNDTRLAITVAENQSVLVDVVSLFPEENGPLGSNSIWRMDLIQRMRDLRPRFIRLPGGCFVEGSQLSQGWYWNKTVGPIVDRQGQWSYWRYWVDNGLGLFEYMELAELLKAEPIYVFNAGQPVTGDRFVPAQTWPMVQDTLHSLEFLLAQSGEWADLRRSMGRVEPWPLKFLGIGNENCGDGFFDDHVRPNPYQDNYLSFYSAIKAAYPWITLLANCDMRPVNMPQDMWERHFYPMPLDNDMRPGAEKAWALRSMFDDYTPEKNGQIFISEFAAFELNSPTAPAGNIQGALGEAGLMNEWEVHSDVIRMAAYAPVMAHDRHAAGPAQLIIFNNNDSFLAPSYYVQQLFSENYGPLLVDSAVTTRDGAAVNVSVSTTCFDHLCSVIATKIVNFQPVEETVTIALTGAGKDVFPNATRITLAAPGGDYLASNSWVNRTKVAPVTEYVAAGNVNYVTLPPWSLTVRKYGLGPQGERVLRSAADSIALNTIQGSGI